MKEWRKVQDRIYESIRFIERKQRQMEDIRLDLNHQIMFNLRDTYLHIANHQTSITIRHLADFLGFNETHSSLEKLVKWNNHCSSFNLTFAQFSAIIVTKEDRLLAKMVLERQEMGAIPNFLLEKVKMILGKEIQLHQFCMKCDLNNQEQLRDLIERFMDQNGDISQLKLQQFLEQYEGSQSQSISSFSSMHQSTFMRFLQSSGNITGQRLLFLWKAPNHLINDTSSKINKLSTNISSPKSLMPSQSCQNLRSEFYDCLNRPIVTDTTQVRQTKSIEKHVNRINSQKRLNIISKFQRTTKKQKQQLLSLLQMIRSIIQIEKQIENARIQLRLCPDFYPILFYETVPKDRSRNITPTNFRDYLESFGYYIQANQIYFLFRRYSSVGYFNFNSFCTIFDTVAKEFNLLQKNRFIQSLQDVNFATKKSYFTLIVSTIKRQIKISQIKLIFTKKISNIRQTVNSFFKYFGKLEGVLTEHQLKDIFKQHLKCVLSLNQVRLFIRRCNRNIPSDQAIQRQNLMRELTPYNYKSIVK